jgi:ADP-ribosylglycohydrolase
MPELAEHRCIASLKAAAIGDAIGKQTETLPHQSVRHWYSQGIRGFEGTPGGVIPRYAGNRRREWRIGETTDDTEQTVAIARAILRDGGVRHGSVGRELLTCTKSLHEGARSLWEFHQAGNPERVAQHHDGCGAAMRIAPVGIVYSSHRLDAIVVGAREASIPTHGGPLALGAAAATAAAVSAAIDGASPYQIMRLAERAAARAEHERAGATEGVFCRALTRVHARLRETPRLDAATCAAHAFPDTPLTIVPLALAIATLTDSVAEAVLLAANIGGDSDSVASIAGAIIGARCPDTVPDDWYAVVERINGHGLVAIGERLYRLRQ